MPNVHVPAARPVEGAAITANAASVLTQTDATAQTRNAVSASESVCARSCSPLSVASQDPCSCQNTTGALPATAPLTKDTIKPVDTTHHSKCCLKIVLNLGRGFLSKRQNKSVKFVHARF